MGRATILALMILAMPAAAQERSVLLAGACQDYRDVSGGGSQGILTTAGTHYRAEFAVILRDFRENRREATVMGRTVRDASLASDFGLCPVKPTTMKSAQVPDIHVTGGACIAARVPKSGFAAASHAKHAVACAGATLPGWEPPPAASFSTCYNHIGPEYAISIVGVYRGTPQRLEEVAGSGGISPRAAALGEHAAEHRRLEALYANGWYDSITQEMFGIV